MNYLYLISAALGLIGGVSGIDCGVKELKEYDFESFKGIHSVTTLKDTPPTQTNVTWYIGICDTISEKIDHCPKNSDLCGITLINLEKNSHKDAVVSEIVGFNTNLQKQYKPFTKDGDNNEDGITIVYKGANWGDNLVDAELRFVCASSSDKDKDLDKFQLHQWDDKRLKVSVKTKAACITDKKDKKKPDNKKDNKKGNDKDDNGESWGWFTWIFIFLVLFLSIYIVGGAWFQYSKGNAIDFQSALREVLENFVSLLKGLPSFVREIIEKFTGNSNRGEYSAV